MGTSAGVVLTMPTSPSTVSCPRAPLSPAGLGQGHTGHVRFLAAVQLPDGFDLLCPTPLPPPDTGGFAHSTSVQESVRGGSERVGKLEVKPVIRNRLQSPQMKLCALLCVCMGCCPGKHHRRQEVSSKLIRGKYVHGKYILLYVFLNIPGSKAELEMRYKAGNGLER